MMKFVCTVVAVILTMVGFCGLTATSGTESTCGKYPPTLLAYWAFDDGKGTAAVDSSGNGHDGTVHNGSWVPGCMGSGIDFNGKNTYVGIPIDKKLDNLTAFSYEAWIKPKVDSHWHILDKGDGDKRLYANGVNRTIDGRVRTSGTHAYSQSVNHTVTIGSWQHVAMTWNNSDNVTRLFINGLEVSYLTKPIGSGTVQADNDYPFTIGARGALGATTFFNGTIDEVYIWGCNLSAKQIKNHYDTNKVPETDLPMAIYATVTITIIGIVTTPVTRKRC